MSPTSNHPNGGYGPIIRAIRTSVGRAQRDVAADAHVQPASLCNIELGKKTASPDLTRRLAHALNVDPAILTGQVPAIRILREAAGLTVDSFARDIHVTVEELDVLERGARNPDPATVAVIARRLGVDPRVIAPRIDLATGGAA